MSIKINQENQKNNEITLQDFNSNIIPLNSSLSQKEINKKEDFFITNDERITENYNLIMSEKCSPYKRLEIIQKIINNKNEELNRINNRLKIINQLEKSKQKPLTFSRKQEIIEDNKIKEKLNLKNISLGKKFLQISEKVKKIEEELLFEESKINYIPIKEKLKEIKNKKESILSKIKENDKEIKKINDKEKKYFYKENQKNFIKNIEKLNQINNDKKYKLKKNELLLTDNNINANEAFNKCLYEEEIQKRIKEDSIKVKKYKELREKELEKAKQRKIIQLENERYLRNNNWIQVYVKNKNYLSWDEKEKERIRKEESLIELEKNKRKIKYSPISSEEINLFSNDIKNKQLLVKNDLKIKKLQLKELWKERKILIPEYKSKFETLNNQYDMDAKNELLLKNEQIKENILSKINFSLDVSQKYRPKIINEKLKRERIEKISELKGINKQKEIKALTNKLKLKAIKLVKSQPKFKLDNIIKTPDCINNKPQKSKNIISERHDKNSIPKEDNINNLENDIRYWKQLLNNKGDIFNSGDNKNNIGEEKKVYKIKKSKSNKVNKSSGSSKININKVKINNIINNMNIQQLNEEKKNIKYINDIKTKLNILNHFIEE